MGSDAFVISLTHRTLHTHTTSLEPVDVPEAAHGTATTAIVPCPSAHLLAEGTETGAVILRHASSFHLVCALDPSTPSPVSSLTASRHSRFLAVGHADGTVAIFDMTTRKQLTTFNLSTSIISLTFQQTYDARYLAVATASSIALFSRVSNRIVSHITPQAKKQHSRSFPRSANTISHAPRITSIAFSPVHIALLATTDDVGCLTVYDTARALPQSRTHPPMASSDAPVYSRFTSALKAPATSLAFAADGVLVAAGFDKLLKVYDPPLKRMLFTVPAPAPISSISYESQPIVGLMDGSLAAVQLDVPASKGAITKRSTVAATGQDATSLAVKQIFVIPSPPKRSRSAKPKDSLPEQASKLVSRKESDDDFLASIDDLVNNARAARRPPSGAQVFSPVSKRSPTPSLSESPSKAASFTEKNTERDVSTPRSRSVHAFTTLEDVSPGERENNDPSPNVGRIPGMMHSKDGKDDLHSIIAKPSEDDGPVQKASVQVCASQLQGSTASEDQIYTAPLESCDSHKTVDHNAEGQRSFPIHFPETASAPPYGSQAFNIPKEDIDNSSQSAITSDDMLTSFSVPSSIRRSLSGSNKELAEPVPDSARGIVADILQLRPRSERPPREQDGSTHIGILRNREGHSKGDESGAQATGSSSDATAERSYPSAADLAESVREVVRQELDVVKTDLRSDILNIHSELILLTARQSEELRTVVKERDQTILQLGKDVERLISDNTRLRQKYGLSS